MAQKPFEIIAECTMAGIPVSTEITQLSERLESGRRRAPNIVRATVRTPAISRDRSYFLEARFLVWAEDGTRAVQAVERLLRANKVPCRGMHLSGRALTEADAPKPSARALAPRPTSPAPRPAARAPKRPSSASKTRAAKPRPKAGRR